MQYFTVALSLAAALASAQPTNPPPQHIPQWTVTDFIPNCESHGVRCGYKFTLANANDATQPPVRCSQLITGNFAGQLPDLYGGQCETPNLIFAFYHQAPVYRFVVMDNRNGPSLGLVDIPEAQIATQKDAGDDSSLYKGPQPLTLVSPN